MKGSASVFLGLLIVALVPPLLIAAQLADVPGANGLNLGGFAADVIAAIAPAVVTDAAFVGIATPVAAAGALAFLAPSKDDHATFALSIVVGGFGWLAYVWLSVQIGDPGGRSGLVNILRSEGAAAQAAADYVVNFAKAGRLLFLVLCATLVGVKLRPSGAAAPMLAAIVLCSPLAAHAATVRVAGSAKDFTVSASVESVSGDAREAFAAVGDWLTYSFDPSVFAEGAYAQRTVVIEWTPKAPNTPSQNVQVFSVEIPLLLRQWRADETIVIDAAPMTGTGEAAVSAYELMVAPGKRWTRLLASLQQADHLAREVSPEFGRTRRAIESAINALAALSAGGTVLPPSDLRERLRQSLESWDPKKFRSLSEALDNVESNLWKDMRTIVENLKGKPCGQVERTFAFLADRKAGNERAYDLQFPGQSDALDGRRTLAMQSCAR